MQARYEQQGTHIRKKKNNQPKASRRKAKHEHIVDAQLDHIDQDVNPGFFARNWGVITFGTLVALGFVALVFSVMFPPVGLVALIAVVASSPVFAWAGVAAVGLVTTLSAAALGVTSALLAKLLVSVNFGAEMQHNEIHEDHDEEMDELPFKAQAAQNSIKNKFEAPNLRRRSVASSPLFDVVSGRRTGDQLAGGEVVSDSEGEDTSFLRPARGRTTSPMIGVTIPKVVHVDESGDEHNVKGPFTNSRPSSPRAAVDESGFVSSDDDGNSAKETGLLTRHRRLQSALSIFKDRRNIATEDDEKSQHSEYEQESGHGVGSPPRSRSNSS